jgi:hypothetical protein
VIVLVPPHQVQHDIKHYGTFGSPKIAKHVHLPQNVTWEREGERAWELANDHVRVYGNVGTMRGTWLGTSMRGVWTRLWNFYGNQGTWLGHNVRYCAPLTHNVRDIH